MIHEILHNVMPISHISSISHRSKDDMINHDIHVGYIMQDYRINVTHIILYNSLIEHWSIIMSKI